MPETVETDIINACPECRAPLQLTHKGDYDTWVCGNGHGIGVGVSEAYEHMQDDEIKAFWQEARKNGQPTDLKSPGLGQPMVTVTVTVDDDEIEGNEGPGSRSVTASVAVDEQFLWFSESDFANMPTDLPNPEMSADEAAKVDAIAKEFGENYAQNVRDRPDFLGKDIDPWTDKVLGNHNVRNGLGHLLPRAFGTKN